MDKTTLLKSLCVMADTVVRFFGRNCEVAIHDLSRLECSLAYIAGSVTGRTVGAPSTDLLIEHIAKHGDAAPDMAPYATSTKDGHPLKSSLSFVRDAKGQLLFAVCMNYNVTGHLQAIALLNDQIRMNTSPDQGESVETFASTPAETSEAIVRKVLREFGKHPVNLNREERITLVCEFQQAGAFRFKGMVEHVAGLMGISKYTLYSYRKQCPGQAGT